jgi:hypothetical protein
MTCEPKIGDGGVIESVRQTDTPNEAEHFSWDDRLFYRDMPGWDTSKTVGWRPWGDAASGVDKIWFVPVPQGQHGVRVYYIPTCPVLATGGEEGDDVTFNGIHGWDEYIVIDTALKIAIKDGTIPTEPLVMQLQKIATRIENNAPNWAPREPMRVRRTRGKHSGRHPWDRWG